MAVVVVLNDILILEPSPNYFFIKPRETLPYKFMLVNLPLMKHHAFPQTSGQCSVPLSLHLYTIFIVKVSLLYFYAQ